MKFTITNKTLNKIVLKDYEFDNVDAAIGQYISLLMLAGIVGMNDKDYTLTGVNTFTINTKGWEMEAVAA